MPWEPAASRISLHTGSPGTAGTANEVTGTGYTRASPSTVSAFTVADDIDFGVAGSPWGIASHYDAFGACDTFVMAPELRVLANGVFQPLEIAEGAAGAIPGPRAQDSVDGRHASLGLRYPFAHRTRRAPMAWPTRLTATATSARRLTWWRPSPAAID